MIRGGKGGAKTSASGLRFESRITLKNAFNSLKGYNISDDKIYFEGKKVAELYQKHKLYKKRALKKSKNNTELSDYCD